MSSMAPSLASIPRGTARMVCCARLMDSSTRYCRRTATRVVISADRNLYNTTPRTVAAPVCDRHAQTILAEIRKESD